MDPDETYICTYLKSLPGQFISRREICRRAAGRKRFRDDPAWAAPILVRLVEKKILESDSTGHYRLKPKEKRGTQKKWVSPQIKKILEQSGRNFTHVIEDDEEN
jgi:hypothetical protein